jgi:hypothetical protein
MLSAIGSAVPSIPTPGGVSPSVLNAQLAKYQTQLADWESCPSCKTPEGKAKIADLQEKIRNIQLRIQSVDDIKTSGVNFQDTNGNEATKNPGDTSTTTGPVLKTSGVGSLLSVYA